MHEMKPQKLGAIAIAGMLAFALTACTNKAEELERKIDDVGNVTAESKETIEGIESEYQALSSEEKQRVGNYDKLKDSLAECNRLVTDRDFLAAIEKSVLSRMENGESDDRKALVNTEFAYLDQFREAGFSDPAIAGAASRYFEGLDMQKESLSKSYEWEYQIEWQRGYVYRLEALGSLHEDCDLLQGNAEFEGSYISKYEDEKAKLDAYDAIEADIASQQDSFEWQWGDNWMSFVVANNTQYEYSTVWEVAFKDESGVVTETSQAICENVKPNSSYTVKAYFSDPHSGYGGSDYNNYYTDIKI